MRLRLRRGSAAPGSVDRSRRSAGRSRYRKATIDVQKFSLRRQRLRQRLNFVVYLLGGSKPLRQIKRDWNVYAIAIDPWGDVYTTDGMPLEVRSSRTHAAGARRCSLLTMTPIARWLLMVPATSTLTIRSSSESTKRAALSCFAPLDWTHTTSMRWR